MISLSLLAPFSDPFTIDMRPIWGIRRNINRQAVLRNIEKERFEEWPYNPSDERKPSWHERRIAYLSMFEGWLDPIEVVAEDGKICISDGYHRFGSAILTEQKEIKAQIFGDTQLSLSFLGVPPDYPR